MSEIVRPAFTGRDRPLLTYGIDFPAAVARHVADTFSASRVYVICSGSLARNTDALDRLTKALGEQKVAGQRIGMTPHTMWGEVLEIVSDARRVQADLLLTLGAGSLTDAAKIVAFVSGLEYSYWIPANASQALANNVSTAEELEAIANGPGKRSNIAAATIPIISVPTSLSAGEYTEFAGGTEERSHRKYMFGPPLRGPQLVALDPELAKTTPDAIWLSTGVRAVDHCVETLCSIQNPDAAVDEIALTALSHLVPGLLLCKKDRTDGDAYLKCQLGSAEAMEACSKGSYVLGASHGIGHQLGPLGVGHGETSCILLPAVCKFNAIHNANRDRQARVRDHLIQDPVIADVLRQRSVDIQSADLGDVLDAIIRQLGLPRSLADVRVGRDQLDMLAANSLHDPMCQTNPVSLTEKGQVLEILEMVV